MLESFIAFLERRRLARLEGYYAEGFGVAAGALLEAYSLHVAGPEASPREELAKALFFLEEELSPAGWLPSAGQALTSDYTPSEARDQGASDGIEAFLNAVGLRGERDTLISEGSHVAMGY